MGIDMDFRNIIKKLAPEGLKEKYRKIREGIIRAEFKVFSLFPIDKDKVVFMNVWGYGDNPKWIAEAYQNLLLETDMTSKRLDKIYFVTGKMPSGRIDAGKSRTALSKTDSHQIPVGINFLKNNSFKANFALATARVWVDCNRKEPYIQKRKGQCYIQTWHGSLPLKKIEGDCRDVLTEEYLENGRRDTAMTDIYISNSDFCNEIYRRAFGFKGKIFCFGSARLDSVLNPDKVRCRITKRAVLSRISKNTLEKIARDLHYSEDNITSLRKILYSLSKDERVKLCVYAPTYREDDSLARQKATESALSLVEALEQKFGGKYVLVTRMHPLAMSRVSQQDSVYLDFEDDNEVVVNGNEFDDIYSLLEAADVLITDYSNTLFEFAYAKKPVFLYAPDCEEYIGSRGMYFDYERLPYPIAKDKMQLRRNIVSYDRDYYLEKQNEFFEGLSLVENGNAASKQAKLIMRILGR